MKTFHNFLKFTDRNPDKLKTLINFTTFDCFTLIEGVDNYPDPIAKLKDTYSILFQRLKSPPDMYIIAARKQKCDEPVDSYIQSL